jgi:inorganic pyrophosphatase
LFRRLDCGLKADSALEKFFIATDELEDKKLEIIGWKGPKIAMKAIKDSAKTFTKDGE